MPVPMLFVMSVASVAVIPVAVSVTSVAMVTTLAIMISVIMPMVTIAFITAIPDNYLVPAAPVFSIPCTVHVVAFPRVTLIYYYFVAMILIVTTVSRG
jgi:hypothetical protein